MSKKKTAKFVMLPWLKGLDSDTDEGIMQFIKKGDHLTEATNIVYGLDGSKTKRDGYAYHDSAAITGAPEIIGGHDYWSNVSSRKSQRIVVWDNQATSKCWFQYGAGGQAWTELTMKAEYELEGVTIKTDAPTSLKSVCFEVFNDDLIMAFTDSQNAGRPPVKWNNMTGTEYETLGGFLLTVSTLESIKVDFGWLEILIDQTAYISALPVTMKSGKVQRTQGA